MFSKQTQRLIDATNKSVNLVLEFKHLIDLEPTDFDMFLLQEEIDSLTFILIPKTISIVIMTMFDHQNILEIAVNHRN